MDDGKCLLDVISDPQALKEFFRSTSQIAFVEGKVPALTDETDNKPEASNDVSRKVNAAFSHISQSSDNQPSQSTSGVHQHKQTKPLAHFAFQSNSGSSLGNFLGNNGLASNTGTRSVALSANSQNLLTSSVQNLGSTKPATTSIAFSEASKARNILSTGSTSLTSAEKPLLLSPKQNLNQKSTPTRLITSPQAGTTVPPQSSKGSSLTLPILRPKNIAPRPQNTSVSQTGQSNPQIAIQGNVLTQGLKTTPQLVAIRPKIVVAPSATGSGLNSQVNSGNSTVRPKQTLQNTFTLGPKGQLTKQILTVPHLKQGITNQPASKPGLANLVQLQPKQIAPKPEQVPAAQSGKAKLTQDQLVQNLLAQSQFGVQTNVGQKDLKQGGNLGQENLTKQQNILQQNQLKKLLQQNQLVQQALQVRAQQQQQQITQQQQHTQAHTQQQQQQNMPLLQVKLPASSSSVIVQQDKTPEIPLSQSTITTANLASQLRDAINTKQLQQFLEKNPIVAQQLRQLNLRQAGLTVGNTRPQAVSGSTVSISNATPVKTVTQLQKPTATVGQLQKSTVNQLQTVMHLQKASLNQKQSLTVGQLQKPTIINQLPKAATNVAQQQKTAISIQKGAASKVAQITKPAATSVAHVTLTNPKKAVSIPSTGQVTQITIPAGGQSTSVQKSDQKSVTTQKVVIVQNANTGSLSAAAAGQPKVLLQTKEGRPILLSQEQFRQIQAQLASKNLSIQGKLVTTAPVGTTTAATVKPQVVVKSEASNTKANQKVLPATAKPAAKQEATKGTKRPIKAVETEESKLIKRMKLTVQKDQNDVCFTDIHKPFKSHQDAITRLTPYHVYSEPTPNTKMRQKANMLLDKLALQLTYKSDKMINKYRQLLLNDMQRDVPSAEVVMVNRIYLADEKAALLKEKQSILEEAKQMAQAARANLSQVKTTANSTDTTTNQQSSTLSTTITDIHLNTCDTIEISDDDSSPITSANSFLTQISNTATNQNVIDKTLEPG